MPDASFLHPLAHTEQSGPWCHGMHSEVLARGSAMPDELVTSIDGCRIDNKGKKIRNHGINMEKIKKETILSSTR